MKKKIVRKYIDQGLGFPVVLLNVPMIEIDGIWTPDIYYKKLERSVLESLAQKPARLTGNEVRFIRNYFEMNLVAFAKRFDVSHPAVMTWERSADEPTDMRWSTEKDIRQEIVLRLASKKDKHLAEKMLRLYESLRDAARHKKTPVQMDCRGWQSVEDRKAGR